MKVGIIIASLVIMTAAPITETERDALAGIVYAEANTEDMTGKQLVAATVLNRVEDERFPDSIEEVIYQPYQYWTKGIPSEIPQACYDAVDSEIEARTNTEVLYFRTGRYHSFGTPVLQHGAHYFSK